MMSPFKKKKVKSEAATPPATPVRVVPTTPSPAPAPPQPVAAALNKPPVHNGVTDSVQGDIAYYQNLANQEKAGKRKLFHSLVKLANELKRVRKEANPLREHAAYANQTWYQGGMWRAPTILPGVQQQRGTMAKLREAISLSDLFLNLVIVTAFTRVGVAITQSGTLTSTSLVYFAIFWTIWNKEASYSTRFDTTDLSAQAGTLVTCFAVLFASLSVNSPLQSVDGTRIMMMALFCSLLHCGLMGRVYWWHRAAVFNTLEHHVQRYAYYNLLLNLVEAAIWISGILAPQDLTYRWVFFLFGVLCSLRIPRAFMGNDFHAACSKRGVLFILLLGFMLQSVVVVATEFFEYDTPSLEQYSFIGASCLMLFCIKLLYVDDSGTLASDHALLVSRTAALCFNLGQFSLLLSTTVMGSGLTMLTHSYLAAAGALPDNAKNLVCGGFAAVLLSIMFIKSMHLKRVPLDPQQKALFVGAYLIQATTTLAVVGVMTAMCYGQGGYFQMLMHNDVELLWGLCGFALFLVALGWLDEGLELALAGSSAESDYLVHPFGFWWCLHPDVDLDLTDLTTEDLGPQPRGLSEMSPLLGESVANMRLSGFFTQDEDGKMSEEV